MDQDPVTTTSPHPNNNLSLRPAWEFAVHVTVGTLIFVVIASGAIAIDIITRSLEPLGIDHVIRYGLKGAEYALFLIDLLLFLVFIAKAGARAIRRL